MTLFLAPWGTLKWPEEDFQGPLLCREPRHLATGQTQLRGPSCLPFLCWWTAGCSLACSGQLPARGPSFFCRTHRNTSRCYYLSCWEQNPECPSVVHIFLAGPAPFPVCLCSKTPWSNFPCCHHWEPLPILETPFSPPLAPTSPLTLLSPWPAMTCMWQLVRGCLQPFSWLLAAAGTPPCSLACRHIALVFASITALLFLCLCVSSPPSAREQGPPQSRVILIMPAKTPFPSKVPGLECAQIFLGATAQHKCRATRDFILFFFKILCIYFYRGEGREKERERNLNVWSSLVRPLLGTWPATLACALTGNWTGHPLLHSWHWVHWAKPARAATGYFKLTVFNLEFQHFNSNMSHCERHSSLNVKSIYQFHKNLEVIFDSSLFSHPVSKEFLFTHTHTHTHTHSRTLSLTPHPHLHRHCPVPCAVASIRLS